MIEMYIQEEPTPEDWKEWEKYLDEQEKENDIQRTE